MPFQIPQGVAFLVGGAVRDGLMGVPIRDRDYVVVGAQAEAFEAAGYHSVGRSFPVFLHPETRCEYALARVDRALNDAAAVSLEEDLARRDLTINAMAQDGAGRLFDPYGGQQDLAAKVLRHVGPAFAQDPLRVLRVARFAAQWADQGFAVAPETMALMKEMVDRGDLKDLPSERLWAEFVKVAKTTQPSVFLRVLRDCGALAVVAPEVDALYGVPQVATHHPEIDTGIHTEMVLDMAVRLAPGNADVAFAALTHDLGKGLTPADVLPKHLGHEKGGLLPLKVMAKRWGAPRAVYDLAKGVCEHHLVAHQAFEVRAGTVLDLLEHLSAFTRPERLTHFLLACEADKRGRLGRFETDYPQALHLKALYEAAAQVSANRYVEEGLEGPAIGEAVRSERLLVIHAIHGPARKVEKPNPPRSLRP